MNFITKTVTVAKCLACGELAVLPSLKPISYCGKCHARYIDLSKILAYFTTFILISLIIAKVANGIIF